MPAKTQPVFEYAGHDQANDRRGDGPGLAAVRVVRIDPLQLLVDLRSELRSDGGAADSGPEFDPPFVAAAILAGPGGFRARGNVEIHQAPFVPLADRQERLGQLAFDDVFRDSFRSAPGK